MGGSVIAMQPRVLLALAVAMAASGACRSRKSRPRPAPPPSVAAAAVEVAEPPRPGHATLTFRGVFAKKIEGDGTACDTHGFEVGSIELGEAKTQPGWSFVAFERQAGRWTAQLSLPGTAPEAEPTVYAWEGAAGAPGLVPTASRLTVALTLSGPHGKTVEVEGELGCPTFSTRPVPVAITALLARHAGGPTRPYSTYDFGRAQHPGAASAIVVGPEAHLEARLRALRRELPSGWVAYVGTTKFLGEETVPEGAAELVVAPGTGPLDILRHAHTDAVNYGMQTEALVHTIAAWDRAWGVDVWHAETDTIELRLTRLPDDMKAFARAVYEFCPDVVDQGTETVDALEAAIAGDRRVFLWWD